MDPLVQRSPLGAGEGAIWVGWKSLEQVGFELSLEGWVGSGRWKAWHVSNIILSHSVINGLFYPSPKIISGLELVLGLKRQ